MFILRPSIIIAVLIFTSYSETFFDTLKQADKEFSANMSEQSKAFYNISNYYYNANDIKGFQISMGLYLIAERIRHSREEIYHNLTLIQYSTKMCNDSCIVCFATMVSIIFTNIEIATKSINDNKLVFDIKDSKESNPHLLNACKQTYYYTDNYIRFLEKYKIILQNYLKRFDPKN